MKRGRNEHHAPQHHHAPTHHQPINQDCSNCGQIGHPWFTSPRIICDGCNQCGHIYTVGRGYHHQGHPAHRTAITHMADDHRALDTPHTDVMTEEVGADSTLGYTRDRSTSHSRHPSADRHASRDRNTGRRHMPDRHRTQSCSPHRQ